MVDFKIQVIVDPSRVKPGMRVVDKELNRTTKSANNLGASLRRALAVIGAGVAIRSATRTLANFSQEMSTVAAVTNATAAEFDLLTERAIDLGTNTRFTATQAAEGMTFLARAGFSAAAAFETIDDTLQLAQAGALDLGRAADIASNVLTGFRLGVGDAARVVDVLALAANSSNTTVGQLGDALKFVAPVAAGVGVAIEDTTAAISALSNAGLQASTAGTGLRRVIATLEQGTPALRDALAGTGVTLADVKVSTVGLIPALTALAEAGIDTGTALEVFGQRGGPAVEVLRSSIPDIIRFREQLGEAEGTAARIAETMDDNLNGAILSTKSALEGLILRLGQSGATGSLRSFFETLTTVLRSAANNIDQFVNGIEGLAFALTVTLARRAIPTAVTAIKSLTVAIATNPFGALATAITLTTGVLIAFRDKITLTEDSTTSLADVAIAAFNRIKEILDSFVPLFTEVSEGIASSLGTSFEGFEFNLQNVLLAMGVFADTSIGIFLGLGNSLTALFQGLPAAVGSGIFTVLGSINNFIEGSIDRVRAFISALGSTFSGLGTTVTIFFRELDIAASLAAKGAFDEASQIAGDAAQLLEDNLSGVGSTFTKSFAKNLEQLDAQRLIEPLANPFEGAGGDLAASMTAGFQEGLEFSGLTDFTLGVFTAADAQRELADAAERVAEAQAKANEQLEAGIPIIDAVGEETDEANDAASELATTAGEGLVSGLNKGLAGMTDVAGAAESLMVNAFGSAEDAIVDFATTGEFNFSGFVDGILADLTRLLARQALLSLISSFGGPLSGLAAQGGSFFGGGKAEGGPVNPNQAFLVGEEGPELFVPPGAGNIATAAETAALGSGSGGGDMVVPAPEVNVSVVNVTDPNDVTAAMDSPQGEKTIVNMISRNRTAIKQALA